MWSAGQYFLIALSSKSSLWTRSSKNAVFWTFYHLNWIQLVWANIEKINKFWFFNSFFFIIFWMHDLIREQTFSILFQIFLSLNFFSDGEISFSGRIQILEDGSLLIAKVRSTDRGKYTCTRSNEAGSISGSAYLSVLVRTQIIQPPVDSKVILGHIASLTCKVSADRNVPFQVTLQGRKVKL